MPRANWASKNWVLMSCSHLSFPSPLSHLFPDTHPFPPLPRHPPFSPFSQTPTFSPISQVSYPTASKTNATSSLLPHSPPLSLSPVKPTFADPTHSSDVQPPSPLHSTRPPPPLIRIAIGPVRLQAVMSLIVRDGWYAAKCNTLLDAKCNSTSTQNMIIFLTQNVMTIVPKCNILCWTGTNVTWADKLLGRRRGGGERGILILAETALDPQSCLVCCCSHDEAKVVKIYKLVNIDKQQCCLKAM